jgi:hypothetical protein
MSSIKGILSLLDQELQQLVASYQKQIDELTKENKSLKAEVDSLISENRQLQEQVALLKHKNSAIENIALVAKSYQDEIDELFLTSSVEDSITLLELCQTSIEEGQMEKVQYILELLVHNPNPLLHRDSIIFSLLERILTKLIMTGSKNFDEFFEKIIESMIQLISELHNTHLQEKMKRYLQGNYSELLDVVLYSNEPKTIIGYLRLMLKYEQMTELKEILSHLIHSEWEFLDYHVSKDEFCFFLWFAFLFDLDQSLLDRAEDSLQWLNEKQSEFELYTSMYDSMNAEKIENQTLLKSLLNQFNQGNIFTEKESVRIIRKVEHALHHLTHQSTAIPNFTGKLFTVKPEELSSLIGRGKLQRKVMFVPLLKSKGVNIQSKYIELEIYYKNDKKAFITTDTVDMVNQKYYPKVLKTRPYDKEIEPIHNAYVQQQPESFRWPSTEIQENSPSSDSSDQPTLNENSELKLLGYQITGLTRAKRWSILEKAVPKLGLKKVAHIIAYNVKLRKGQKNGMVKFKYAIGEWEYDLEKLKKTYYKKDFVWPSV